MRGRRSAAAALAVAALTVASLLTGCSSTQSGLPAPAGWTSTPAAGWLASIPSTFDSRHDIGLVNPAALNRVALIGGDDAPTTAPSTGGRPPSEVAWFDDSINGSVCATYLDGRGSAPGPSPRTGPPGLMLSVSYETNTPEKMIGICAGPVDPAALANPKLRGAAEVTPETVAGVAGTSTDKTWVGYRAELQTTYIVGAEIPDDTREGVVGGTAAGTSLAADPGVRAVLSAAPHAAMIEMGTVLLRDHPLGSTDALEEAVSAAMADAGVQAMPVAEFAGYGWTPGQRVVGTSTFVTTYGSAQEAAAVGRVLAAVWPKLPSSPLGAAATAVEGSTVITTLPEVEPGEFTLRGQSLQGYPGFVTRD